MTRRLSDGYKEAWLAASTLCHRWMIVINQKISAPIVEPLRSTGQILEMLREDCLPAFALTT
jgi:hypothetical protein